VQIPSGAECRRLTEPTTVEADQGDQFAFSGLVAVALRRPDGSFGPPTVYDALPGGSASRLTAQLPQMVLKVAPAATGASLTWCALLPTG
jgi:hypothetical protein